MKENRFYWLIRNMAKVICWVVFPTKVIGWENVPMEGAVLLCSNHVSLVDPVLLACSLKRRVSFMAKKELFSTKFGNWFFRSLGMVPVDRGASDIQALRVCIEALNEGGMMGIFPQGHRHKNDDMHEIQNGAALMALRSKAVVVAAHVSAPMKAFRRTTIRISRPVDLSDFTRVNSQAITAASARITEAIWEEK